MGTTVRDYYEIFDEWGRLDREPLEFFINLHFLLRYLPASGHIADIGSGPGKYAIELARRGYRVGLADLIPRFVAEAREKAGAAGVDSRFSGFHVSNAASLDCFADESFDAAVMMGPLYHLQEQEERIQAIRELYRVTKPGGIVAAAFMPRVAFMQQSIRNPMQWKPNNRIDALMEFSQSGIFNHSEAGRFTGVYFEKIERIIPQMEEEGFETLNLIGSDSFASALDHQAYEYWRDQGEEVYHQLMELVMELSMNPSMLGSSTHLLYIGRRK
ncbi:class I SAM-dependent methyltransferase [Paenibacillus sp. 1011MAR3C5]|uniref:class I SAM-dependent methyltransferase n=1 Tax=Paenibacillus sp. 1011MAR3C5 TaxID=1675787 RepID=UPI000E6CFE75|nr:class I SAM-dependent methyltransferase [Paenibacillus sp. 1011MAR3C5]RJE87664.1 class I SAM-dependent methyltransferase [Paenibacillus sp. 1011MAR3C5]